MTKGVGYKSCLTTGWCICFGHWPQPERSSTQATPTNPVTRIVYIVSQAVAKARIQKRGVDRQTVHTQELRIAQLDLGDRAEFG